MSKVVAFVALKGGVGKTTLAVHLAAFLARAGERVLLVDVGTQRNAIFWTSPESLTEPFFPDLMAGSAVAPSRTLSPSQSFPGLMVGKTTQASIIQAASALAADPLEGLFGLKSSLDQMPEFSWVVVDTPPENRILVLNALVAATHVVVPIRPTVMGLQALRDTHRTIATVQERLNPRLSFVGVVPNLCTRVGETAEVIEEIKKVYPLLPELYQRVLVQNAVTARTDVLTLGKESDKAVKEMRTLLTTIKNLIQE